jgi:hypothetical protein
LAGVLCLALTTHAAGTEVIGRVKITSGDAFIISKGVSTRAVPGSLIKAADTLITGSSGSIGITLRDDTRISLGPTSAMLMKAFEFEPLQGRHSFVGRITKGSMLYESHWTGKTASLETPNATIGIRGTRFLIRVEDD